MTVTFKEPVAVPHKYRNRFLRESGANNVIVSGGSGSGASVDLTPYLKKTDAAGLYLGINENAVSATKIATAVSLWGQSFDGTSDVTGSITIKEATPTLNFNYGSSNSYNVRIVNSASGVIELLKRGTGGATLKIGGGYLSYDSTNGCWVLSGADGGSINLKVTGDVIAMNE